MRVTRQYRVCGESKKDDFQWEGSWHDLPAGETEASPQRKWEIKATFGNSRNVRIEYRDVTYDDNATEVIISDE